MAETNLNEPCGCRSNACQLYADIQPETQKLLDYEIGAFIVVKGCQTPPHPDDVLNKDFGDYGVFIGRRKPRPTAK